MQDINVRGSFAVTRACMPHLRAGTNPHILTLSPPIDLRPEWLGPHIGYTLAKYGMSLLALGWAAELARGGRRLERALAAHAGRDRGGPEPARRRRRDGRARRPEIYADAAYAILSRPSRECTGNTFLCEDVLAEEGVTDLVAVQLRRGRRAAGRPVRRPRLAASSGYSGPGGAARLPLLPDRRPARRRPAA